MLFGVYDHVLLHAHARQTFILTLFRECIVKLLISNVVWMLGRFRVLYSSLCL